MEPAKNLASPDTYIPLEFGPSIVAITLIKNVYQEAKLLLQSWFYDMPHITKEDLARAPWRIVSFLSNVTYSSISIISYCCSLALAHGALYSATPLFHVASYLILPVTFVVAIVDSGLNIDAIMRSLDFHEHLHEHDIEMCNKALAIWSSDAPQQTKEERMTHLLKNYEGIPPHEYTQGMLSKETLEKYKSIFIRSAVAHLKDTKEAALQRYIGDWGRVQTQATLQALEEQLESGALSKVDEERVESLLNDLKVQGQKTRLIHVIVLASLIILILGCIATCIGCPYIIPFVLFIVASTIGFGGWGYGLATLPCKGWEWRVRYIGEGILGKTATDYLCDTLPSKAHRIFFAPPSPQQQTIIAAEQAENPIKRELRLQGILDWLRKHH